MSTVTSQPLPLGQLEREKHIQMIFRAFQKHHGPSCECRFYTPGPKSNQTLPGCQMSTLDPERKVDKQLPEKLNKLGLEEPTIGGSAESDFMSMLETVSQIHITARPELQGERVLWLFLCVTAL